MGHGAALLVDSYELVPKIRLRAGGRMPVSAGRATRSAGAKSPRSPTRARCIMVGAVGSSIRQRELTDFVLDGLAAHTHRHATVSPALRWEEAIFLNGARPCQQVGPAGARRRCAITHLRESASPPRVDP
jgi:hypothetical protein